MLQCHHNGWQNVSSFTSIGFRISNKRSPAPFHYLLLPNNSTSTDADLWVEGQSLGVIGVDHRGVGLKDDALARRLECSAAHRHKEIYHLRNGKENMITVILPEIAILSANSVRGMLIYSNAGRGGVYGLRGLLSYKCIFVILNNATGILQCRETARTNSSC